MKDLRSVQILIVNVIKNNSMDELRGEYVIPIKPVEMIDCSYLPNKKSKSRAGSTPYACKRKKKRKK